MTVHRSSLVQPTSVGTARTGLSGTDVVLDSRGVAWMGEFRLLVVSDLHLEKGSSHARRGSLLPPYDSHLTLNRLDRIVSDYDPAVVVSLGDSFHDSLGASRLDDTCQELLLKMMAGRDWIWIAGNHDPDLPENLPGHRIAELAFGDIVLRHEPLRRCGSGEISGHLHPSARILRRNHIVKRPCFVTDGMRLIMPAFGAYTGTLDLASDAFADLFEWPQVIAFMLGAEDIYPIRSSHVCGLQRYLRTG